MPLQAGLLEADAKKGALGVGERGAEVRRLFGRVARFPYEITHFEPPCTWGFCVLEGPVRPSAVLSDAEPLARKVVNQAEWISHVTSRKIRLILNHFATILCQA